MKFKSLFASILTVALLLTSVGTVFATNDSKVKQTQSINEYDYLKELKQKSNVELKSMNFSDEKIIDLKKLNYKEEVIKRSKLDTETLKLMGYTDDKISLLKNFTGTEREMQALSGNVTVSAYIDYVVYSSSLNRTELATSFYWQWDSCPFWEYTDMVVIGWSSGFIQTSTNGSNNYVSVSYTGGQQVTKSWVAKAGQGCSCAFPVGYNGIGTNWAKSGYAYAKALAPGNVTMVGVNFSYGHTIVVGSPSVNWNGVGGFGFSLTTQESPAYRTYGM